MTTKALAIATAALGLIASILALWAKLMFWGGAQYAPFYVKAQIWYLILAGPVAALIVWRRPSVALLIVAAQAGLVLLMSI